MEKRIFFISSCLFCFAAVVQFFLDIAYPIPLDALVAYRPNPFPAFFGSLLFASVVLGLLTFAYGCLSWIAGGARHHKDDNIVLNADD